LHRHAAERPVRPRVLQLKREVLVARHRHLLDDHGTHHLVGRHPLPPLVRIAARGDDVGMHCLQCLSWKRVDERTHLRKLARPRVIYMGNQWKLGAEQ
jgi:hypothetical protein